MSAIFINLDLQRLSNNSWIFRHYLVLFLFLIFMNLFLVQNIESKLYTFENKSDELGWEGCSRLDHVSHIPRFASNNPEIAYD